MLGRRVHSDESPRRMKRLFSCVLLVGLLGLPLTAVAQFGPYTKTGVGFGAGASAGDNASTAGLNAGYVFGAPVEIGGELSRRAFEDTDLTATRFGPYAVVYPVQEDQGYPLSILIRGSYERVHFSGGRVDDFQQEGGSDTGNRLRLDVGAFPTLDVSESLRLLPYVGVRYALHTEADAFREQEEITGLDFRLSVQYNIGDVTSVVATPIAFVKDDNSTRFGLSAVFVFSRTGAD